MTGEHRLELLGHADSHHPRLGGGGQIGTHHLGLAITLGETHKRDPVVVSERQDRLAETVADLVEQCR